MDPHPLLPKIKARVKSQGGWRKSAFIKPTEFTRRRLSRGKVHLCAKGERKFAVVAPSRHEAELRLDLLLEDDR